MKHILYLFLFHFVFSYAGYGQTKNSINPEEFNSYFAKMTKDWDIPGLSIGIVKDGQLVFTGNYGVKEVGGNERPNKNTLYAIASNSKAFTSAIIGMLVQEGKLKWNDKVKKHLPYFELYDTWVSANTTIRDILSHRVGLGTFSGDNIWYKSELSAEEIIKRIKYVPQAYDFRAGYGYSNLMFITAGEVIKKVTGKTWSENVKERILVPLNMNRTISSINDLDEKGNYATPHARKDDQNYKIPWANWDEVAATGGLISSVEDIAKWMIFNLNNGIHKNDTILSKSTRNLVWTPHNNRNVDHTSKNDFNRHFNAYGLGWGLSDYHGRMKVGHTGGYDGMITAVTLIPDENIGVVVLTNGVKSPIMAATYYTLDKLLSVETIDWSKKYLEQRNKNEKSDLRITDRKAKRELNTSPSIPIEKFSGEYFSDMYGKITIEDNNGQLKLNFEHSPLLSASLTHWHHDVWEIKWDHEQAWFSFGTIKINANNNMEVVGFDFDVPNDDFFFEELKPYRLSDN
jgi:CubicO group peptidase (beta-lactamase class C family)